MRFDLLVISAMTLAAAGTFWYRSTETMCPVPLTYHIGTIAPEFNLSEEKIAGYLTDAESVWEKEAGRNLFSRTEKGDVTVNFIFDERQALADSQVNQKTELDKKRDETEDLMDSIDELRADYDKQSVAYRDVMAAYERKLNAYNQKVSGYNDQGGAPSGEFEKLEAEKAALNRESNKLNATSDTLNLQAQKINQLSQKSSELIDIYNAQVAGYNKEFGFSREFTQGDYQDRVINIYKFSTDDEVRTVLAHELGHALGIGHVEGESSVMYYLLENTSSFPSLSDSDREALLTVCGTGERLDERIRAGIRSILATFNT